MAVVDNKYFEGKLADGGVHYKFLQAKVDTLKNTYPDLRYTGLLHIPAMDINRPTSIVYYGKGADERDAEEQYGTQAEHSDRTCGWRRRELTKGSWKVSGRKLTLSTFGERRKKGQCRPRKHVVGYAAGFLVYIILLIFGTTVMRGVMEER